MRKEVRWILASVGILLIPVASAISARFFQTSFGVIMSTLTTLASLFLSLVLAYLYMNFSSIQRDQKEIMNQQKRLSMRQMESKPEIKSLSISSAKDPSYRFGEYRDEVYVSIMNHGESVMEDLAIVCVIRDDPGEYVLQFDGDTIRPNINSARNIENFGNYGDPVGGILPPDEETRFKSTITFQRENDAGTLAISVSDVLNKCKEYEVDSIDFYLGIVYSDSTGEDKIQRLTGFITDIDEGVTMEEAFDSDNMHGLVMDDSEIKSNTVGV